MAKIKTKITGRMRMVMRTMARKARTMTIIRMTTTKGIAARITMCFTAATVTIT